MPSGRRCASAPSTASPRYYLRILARSQGQANARLQAGQHCFRLPAMSPSASTSCRCAAPPPWPCCSAPQSFAARCSPKTWSRPARTWLLLTCIDDHQLAMQSLHPRCQTKHSSPLFPALASPFRYLTLLSLLVVVISRAGKSLGVPLPLALLFETRPRHPKATRTARHRKKN